jgi:hypothetical protein
MSNRSTYKLNGILAQARKIKPSTHISFPFMNAADFYNSDNQTIQLDHVEANKAVELICDTTAMLIEKREVDLGNGVIATLTTAYSRPASITMNIKYKAIKIENFARENGQAETDWNTLELEINEKCNLLVCENDPIDLIYQNGITKVDLTSFEAVKFINDVVPTDTETAKLINGLANTWLTEVKNYQLTQELMQKAFDNLD